MSRAKIKFVGIGAGNNINNEIKKSLDNNTLIDAEITYTHIDTSTKDTHEGIPTLIVGEGNGSGGKKTTNYDASVRQKAQIMQQFEDNDTLYVFITGTNGGTSIVLLSILADLTDKHFIILAAEDNSNRTYLKATKGFYQTVNGYAAKNRSVAIFNIENGASTFEQANKEFVAFTQGLVMFFNDDNKSLDATDMRYFLTPDEHLEEDYHGQAYKISLVGLAEDDNDIFTDSEVVGSRELVTDGDFTGQKTELPDGFMSKQGATAYPIAEYEDTHKLVLTLELNYFTRRVVSLNERWEAAAPKTKVIKVDIPSGDDFIILD